MANAELPGRTQPSTVEREAYTAGDTAALRSQTWKIEAMVVTSLTVAFLFVEIRAANHVPMWFDELSTFFMVRQPSLAEMFRAIPTDGNPPLYFLLARLFLFHSPLSTELAMRMPAILAYNLTAIGAFIFIRRIASFPAALLAMSLMLGSTLGVHYAIEARAYSVLLFFTMLLLCCWQEVKRGSHRVAALAGMAISASCCVLTHQYGVIYAVVPILVAETVGWIQSKRLDYAPLACTVVASAATMAYTYPTMMSGQRSLLQFIRTAQHFWARPHAYSIEAYSDIFPLPVTGLIVIAAVIWLVLAVYLQRRPKPTVDRPAPSAAEFAPANALFLFLPLMLVLTKLGTGYFLSRYAIGSTLGLALTAGLVADRALFRWPQLRLLVYFPVIYCALIGISRFQLELHPLLAEDHGVALMKTAPAGEPIVIESALEFSPAWWYADASLRPRLHYLSDLDYSYRNSDLLPEYSLEWEKRYTPMQMDRYDTFIAAHNEFVIFSVGQSRVEWLRTRLTHAGWKVDPLKRDKSGALYIAHRRS